jgi:phosphatidate cytidylyltransferase
MDSANAASAPSQSKSSSLPTRVASALIIGPGLLLAVWLGGIIVEVVAVVAVLLALRELYALVAAAGYRPRWSVGYAAALCMLMAAVWQARGGGDLSGLALMLVLGVALIAELGVREREGTLAGWGLTIAGALYISWFLSHLVLMRGLQTPLQGGLGRLLRIEPGAAWVYTALGITWANDTCAYLVGRRFGRRRMAPYLSPKKSWEGAFGGLLGAVVWSLCAVPLLGLPIGYGGALLLAVVGTAAGVLGDLSESLIKRQAGVKDSGKLIPGHGGLLDRIDSLLFVGPALYYLIVLLASSR